MIARSLLILLLWIFSSTLAKADDDSKVEINATEVAPSIYFLEGAGGNVTAFLGRDGVVLIDDDFADMSAKLVSKLKALGGSGPRIVVNTHFHYDHTGGNLNFGSSATIISSEETRKYLMSDQTLWRQQHPAYPQAALPLVTFAGSMALHLDDEDIRLEHVSPGHTNGDVVAFFQKHKVVCMGDLYFAGMFPIFHPEHGGSLSGLIADLNLVLGQIPDDAQIVPGHGPLSSKAQLRDYRDMILATVEVVRTGIKNGQSLAQIQKAGLPSKWMSYSHGYASSERWIAEIDSALRPIFDARARGN